MIKELQEDDEITPQHYMAVRSDGLAFGVCLWHSVHTPELVKQFDRLYGTNLQRHGSPMDIMVDDATGKAADDMRAFIRFVWNYVFIRVAPINP